ncbi:MAG TPA: type IVB secretion system protein IcmH/DotU [Novosphingobium sp.]|nr:type IVB secretion system protein IcmH/DotU [Novosphingobium sp.]
MREEGAAMTGQGSSDNGNRTVFRPSPLSGMRQTPQDSAPGGQAAGGWGAPPPISPPGAGAGGPPAGGGGFAAPPSGFDTPPPAFAAPGSMPDRAAPTVRLNDDDIPVPAMPRDWRSPLVVEAGPVLALVAAVRSGRARIALPELHREATEAVATYDRAIAPLYADETRMRARYALCATIDDIAQNLPGLGSDGAEWARRSMVVSFFRETIGGDRFWQLVDDLIARPAQNAELIELYAECLSAGFEGRFRVMPDGRARLQQIHPSLYGALEHPRALSQVEMVPHWRGADAPLRRISGWNRVALAAAAAIAFLLVIYIILRLLLMTAGADSLKSAKALMPGEPLRLSRLGAAPPPAMESGQLVRLRQFLEPEIRQQLVAVEEDGTTVRVRTTVGQLFQSGSDRLEPGRAALFERIGRAVEGEPGQVTVEGHSDSDQIASLAFPDNTALSRARADAVAGIIASVLSNPGRIGVQGFGDGKALNRRVEIVIPRQP